MNKANRIPVWALGMALVSDSLGSNNSTKFLLDIPNGEKRSLTNKQVGNGPKNKVGFFSDKYFISQARNSRINIKTWKLTDMFYLMR